MMKRRLSPTQLAPAAHPDWRLEVRSTPSRGASCSGHGITRHTSASFEQLMRGEFGCPGRCREVSPAQGSSPERRGVHQHENHAPEFDLNGVHAPHEAQLPSTSLTQSRAAPESVRPYEVSSGSRAFDVLLRACSTPPRRGEFGSDERSSCVRFGSPLEQLPSAPLPRRSDADRPVARTLDLSRECEEGWSPAVPSQGSRAGEFITTASHVQPHSYISHDLPNADSRLSCARVLLPGPDGAAGCWMHLSGWSPYVTGSVLARLSQSTPNGAGTVAEAQPPTSPCKESSGLPRRRPTPFADICVIPPR